MRRAPMVGMAGRREQRRRTPMQPFHRPRRTASEQLAGFTSPPQHFQPLPPPTGPPPFRFDLATALGADAVAAIEQAGTLVFHTVGDTGGVKSPQPQEIVAMWMENDFTVL